MTLSESRSTRRPARRGRSLTGISGCGNAIDGLQALPLAGLDEDTVLDVTRAVEVARRRLPTVEHALVAELEVRSTAVTRLHRGTASLLSELLHIDAGQARARVQAAGELGPRTSITGDVRGPLHPAAAAQAVGRSRGAMPPSSPGPCGTCRT